jgi:hypothetical protein
LRKLVTARSRKSIGTVAAMRTTVAIGMPPPPDRSKMTGKTYLISMGRPRPLVAPKSRP